MIVYENPDLLQSQSQSDTPIITSRKIRKAKMKPDTAYTIAEVKDMETVVRDIVTRVSVISMRLWSRVRLRDVDWILVPD